MMESLTLFRPRHCGRCKQSGKLMWINSAEAAMAAAAMGNIGRFYRCPDCGKFHLTRSK